MINELNRFPKAMKDQSKKTWTLEQYEAMFIR